MGSYRTEAEIILQHIAKKEGGFDKLKGKKIALVYHDSPYGKEPIALLQKRAQMHGFETLLLPVTHPGVEQKATWLQIRQNRPDYVLLWGWGVMNSTAIKEAVAVGYPRANRYGVPSRSWTSPPNASSSSASRASCGRSRWRAPIPRARERAASRLGTARNGMSRRIGSRPTTR